MANATVSRIGADSGGGDKQALFLKVFSGEVLASFNERNMFLARTMSRSISSGKSAQQKGTGPTLNFLLNGETLRGNPVPSACVYTA